MRLRFWIIFLALANMGFWLWLYANSDLGQREPERLQKQFNADKIQVLASNDAAQMATSELPNSAQTGVETVPIPLEAASATTTADKATAPPPALAVATQTTPAAPAAPTVLAAAPTAAPAPTAKPNTPPTPAHTAPPTAPKPVPSAAVPVAPATASCLRVGNFSGAEEKSFLRLLKNQKLTIVGHAVNLSSGSERYIVYLGPYKNQRQAQQQAQLVKRKTNFAQVSTSAPWRVVLGSFGQKEIALVGQKRLTGLGLKTKIDRINQKLTALDFKDLNPSQSTQLKAIVKKLRGPKLRACQ